MRASTLMFFSVFCRQYSGHPFRGTTKFCAMDIGPNKRRKVKLIQEGVTTMMLAVCLSALETQFICEYPKALSYVSLTQVLYDGMVHSSFFESSRGCLRTRRSEYGSIEKKSEALSIKN